MTMPSLTFLDKTSILIPRSKAFLTRPRYCLPFLCQDKEWRNSAFHEFASVVMYATMRMVYRKPFASNKSMQNNLKYTLSDRKAVSAKTYRDELADSSTLR